MIDHFKNLIHALRRSLKIFESGSKKSNEELNLGTKKPLNLGGSGGFSVVNTGILTVSSILHNASQNQVYDAEDIIDVHALAERQLNWLASLVSTVKQNIDSDRIFHNKELLEITQYLAESFAEDHENKSKKYKIE